VPKSARKEVIVVHLRSKAKAEKEFINKVRHLLAAASLTA
jgi:hypothetical protein